MPRVTFGENTAYHVADCDTPDAPSNGDLIMVLWDTTDEVHVFGCVVREWVPCIVMSVPEPPNEKEIANETTVYTMLYLPDTLRALYGRHNTMRVNQDLSKLRWCWYNAPGKFEYDAHRELVRFSCCTTL